MRLTGSAHKKREREQFHRYYFIHAGGIGTPPSPISRGIDRNQLFCPDGATGLPHKISARARRQYKASLPRKLNSAALAETSLLLTALIILVFFVASRKATVKSHDGGVLSIRRACPLIPRKRKSALQTVKSALCRQRQT